jgi:NAD(P)-dependent dehydrogenase (short-subunit alcohol dehydrogenase family)
LRPLLDGEVEQLAELLAVNLLAPYQLSKSLGGAMALRKHGTIVNISSDAAVEPYPGWGFYAASKAALDQLSRVWAAELATRDVRVLSVDPGEMDTQMHADALPDADRSELARPEEVAARIVAMLGDHQRAASGARLAAAAFEVAS